MLDQELYFDEYSPTVEKKRVLFISPGVGALLGGGISGGAGLIGSLFGAGAQTTAANTAAQTEKNYLNTVLGIEQPFLNTGYSALGALGDAQGLTGAYTLSPYAQGKTPWQPITGGSFLPGALAPSSIATSPLGSSGYPLPIQNALENFTGSPDYQFALQQGNLATNQQLAASGQLASGGALRAGQQFGQGLASQQYQNYFGNLMTGLNTAQNEYQNYFGNATNINAVNQQNYQNYFNQLSALAGIGQATGGQLSGLTNSTGSNVASTQLYGGASQAAGAVGAANAVGGAGNNAFSNYLLASYLPGSNSSSYNYSPSGAFGNYNNTAQNFLNYPSTPGTPGFTTPLSGYS